jgi:hypothetical protein
MIVTNTVTGETREIEQPTDWPLHTQCSTAVRKAHKQDHPDPDNTFVYNGPIPTWTLDPERGGIWTCGEWETPGPSRLQHLYGRD